MVVVVFGLFAVLWFVYGGVFVFLASMVVCRLVLGVLFGVFVVFFRGFGVG